MIDIDSETLFILKEIKEIMCFTAMPFIQTE